MAAKPKGMIDLGKSYGGEVSAKTADYKDRVSYPSLNLSDVKALDDLPDGEFYFVACGKVTAHSESEMDGKTHCSCTIEVRSIKPISAKEAGAAPSTLEDALDEIAEGKDEPADEAPDEDDSEE